MSAAFSDVHAKVLADNLGSLVCQAASEEADLPQRQRTCNRSYAAHLMQRMLPRMGQRGGQAAGFEVLRGGGLGEGAGVGVAELLAHDGMRQQCGRRNHPANPQTG